MACKRSAVRSRYSPPKSTVLRRKYGAFLFTEADFGDALSRLHAFLAFAENRDVPADKRAPITEEIAVQQAAVPRSLLLFSAPRDGHSSLCFLYEPCSRPSAGGSQNGTTQNIRRVMDTEVHPRECDENAYRQSRHRPLSFSRPSKGLSPRRRTPPYGPKERRNRPGTG